MKKGLILSDTHAAHRAGLTHPDYISSNLARVASPFWQWFSDEMEEIGLVDIVIFNGDAVEGPGKKDTRGIITTDTEEQGEMCLKALSPVKTKKWRLTYGTPYHVSGTHDYENAISSALDGNIRDEQFIDINGFKISARHVVGGSATPYTPPTQAYKELIRDLVTATREGTKPANMVVRSHVHYSVKVEMDGIALITPCLKLPGREAFGRKLRPFYYHVGYVYFEINEKGKLEILKVVKMPFEIYSKRTYECL